ncbi:MAG TPA: hypothetical protein VMT85_17110 [Thermoanaerobaculia bacterium]|nr:hypothetical protein [Thermoanaerobaculia bacterium]
MWIEPSAAATSSSSRSKKAPLWPTSMWLPSISDPTLSDTIEGSCAAMSCGSSFATVREKERWLSTDHRTKESRTISITTMTASTAGT